MMRWAFVVGWVLWAVAGCDDGAELVGECARGERLACERAEGCRAARICMGNPGEWGPCECVGPIPDAGAPRREALGAECMTDRDCPTEAFCLAAREARYYGGGPVDGVCVASCDGDPGACDAFDNARCVEVFAGPGGAGSDDASRGRDDEDGGVDAGNDTEALCFERCHVGEATPDKCHGRVDVACEAVSESAPRDGFCRPVCAADDDCGEGRGCDVRTGACVAGAGVEDGRLGEACVSDGGPGQCDGLCVELSEGYGVCGHRCVFGEGGDCAPLMSSAPRGGCVLAAEMGGIGDVGFCGELCDCEVACGHPDAVCDGFADAELVRVFGRAGACVPEELALGERLTCK